MFQDVLSFDKIRLLAIKNVKNRYNFFLYRFFLVFFYLIITFTFSSCLSVVKFIKASPLLFASKIKFTLSNSTYSSPDTIFTSGSLSFYSNITANVTESPLAISKSPTSFFTIKPYSS